MARKAGRARIKAAMGQYAAWRGSIDPLIAALTDHGARKYLTEWADDVRQRIEGGELGVCTQALIASVQRDLRAWQDGLFSHVAPNGARVHA